MLNHINTVHRHFENDNTAFIEPVANISVLRKKALAVIATD